MASTSSSVLEGSNTLALTSLVEETPASTFRLMDLMSPLRSCVFSFVDVEGQRALTLTSRGTCSNIEKDSIFPLFRNLFNLIASQNGLEIPREVKEEVLSSFRAPLNAVRDLRFNASSLTKENILELYAEHFKSDGWKLAGFSSPLISRSLFQRTVQAPLSRAAGAHVFERAGVIIQQLRILKALAEDSHLFTEEESLMVNSYCCALRNKLRSPGSKPFLAKWALLFSALLPFIGNDSISSMRKKQAVLHISRVAAPVAEMVLEPLVMVYNSLANPGINSFEPALLCAIFSEMQYHQKADSERPEMILQAALAYLDRAVDNETLLKYFEKHLPESIDVSDFFSETSINAKGAAWILTHLKVLRRIGTY